MAVWPALMALAAAVTLLSAFARDTSAARAAGVILAAYVCVRLAIPHGMSAVALVWLIAALVTFSINRYGISLILVAVSVCYVWARVVSAPWVFGSPPFVISDCLAALALLIIGSGVRRAVIDRACDLARACGSRGFAVGADRAGLAPQKAKQAGR
jgi:hypothetical protein